MQKKLLLMILAGVLCLSLVGCGRSGDTQPEEEDNRADPGACGASRGGAGRGAH